MRRDFERLFKIGQSAFSPYFSLKFCQNNLEQGRMAVIISAKTTKKAVERNKIRRRIKNIIQPELERLKGWDLAIIIKPEAKEQKFSELKNSLLKILKKIPTKTE